MEEHYIKRTLKKWISLYNSLFASEGDSELNAWYAIYHASMDTVQNGAWCFLN